VVLCASVLQTEAMAAKECGAWMKNRKELEEFITGVEGSVHPR
jgi:hypothetical protein